MRDLPGSRTLCLVIIQGDLPGARTLCLMNTKEGCLTPPGTLRIWQNVGDLRGKKVWYILLMPGRFLENMGTHIIFKKGVPHKTQQLSGLWKNWAPSVDFFYGHNPYWKNRQPETNGKLRKGVMVNQLMFCINVVVVVAGENIIKNLKNRISTAALSQLFGVVRVIMWKAKTDEMKTFAPGHLSNHAFICNCC